MVNHIKMDVLRCELDLLESEILNMKGKMRNKTKKKYIRLIQSSAQKLELDQPIYLLRCE